MQSKQCGFSLIEVMISFLLIGVGALGLVKLQAYIELRADHAMHSIEALNLAEQKLEWFRTRGALSAVPSMPAANFDTSIVSGEDTTHPLYTLSWSVPAATLSGALKTIHIEALWQDRHGETQSVELKTMISKHSEFD
ncbi:TPA: prepilin-type N-terminal cleavage/methylation domain-containing protein [Vibrio parahaemolyticus]|uniref:Prepilin-type N-terminal cleavage/methylation domain-containing protein n=1 Tax=Vibrio parahaemolyticus TaxID=670 RepID=A0AA46UIX2_VIBPH|nr:prepilin-type N-terminal cleavage/methylation domain-containing protein [Vibrio parahaemolyticus]EGQ8232849.1 prepilin-type N-terminal cleavage/methylation domain-containing protein [Vibrio parahaemolyticus]EGR1738293.1 prepilin-type N-terminal cleavage/methylation domain-containing protein [Vibrio parahaemolyticus]EGX7690286.1 prepilin-type N-terminal cleavage/methylation domain-containing protein [Vibrio parahaemolyticus]EIC5075494.1 prepilin-type N-terminal cleavage/methylation domain-con